MRRYLLASLLGAALGAALVPAGVAAGASSTIAVTNAWARATPQGAQTGAAFITVVNHGTTDDKLIGASTPVAKMAQLHRTIDDHGVMKMRPIAADRPEARCRGDAQARRHASDADGLELDP